jgi:uncharacterized protein YjbI with pentapeptide repeats
MAQFARQDLTGSRCEWVRLRDARFQHADLSGAELREIDLDALGAP